MLVCRGKGLAGHAENAVAIFIVEELAGEVCTVCGACVSKTAAAVCAGLCNAERIVGKIDFTVQAVFNAADVEHKLAVDKDPNVVVAGEFKLNRRRVRVIVVHAAGFRHGERNGGVHAEIVVGACIFHARCIIIREPAFCGIVLTIKVMALRRFGVIQIGIARRRGGSSLRTVGVEIRAELIGIKGVIAVVCIDKRKTDVRVHFFVAGVVGENTGVRIVELDILAGVQLVRYDAGIRAVAGLGGVLNITRPVVPVGIAEISRLLGRTAGQLIQCKSRAGTSCRTAAVSGSPAISISV